MFRSWTCYIPEDVNHTLVFSFKYDIGFEIKLRLILDLLNYRDWKEITNQKQVIPFKIQFRCGLKLISPKASYAHDKHCYICTIAIAEKVPNNS